MTFAFGAEQRTEEYEIGAGEYASFAIGPLAPEGFPSGSNGFPGFSPEQSGSSDQTSYAAYVDVEAPITDRWTVGAAVRFEDFSEFGNDTNGKLSTRYEVSPNLALRATASTGFRAPTPGTRPVTASVGSSVDYAAAVATAGHSEDDISEEELE